MPKVSVLLPVYNGEPYIAECIESILNQTFTDFELLVLNDGSTDRTLEIVRQYDDPRIRIIDHEDIGQANNLNDGLGKALGDYVCEVDADDYISATHLDHLYTEAYMNNADVVKCNFNEFHEEDGIRLFEMQQAVPGVAWCGKDLCITSLPEFAKNVLICRTPCVFSGMYRRKFLIENCLFWRENKAYEDTSLSFKIAASAKVFRWLNIATYYHRADNPNSGTSTIFDFEGLSEQITECRIFSLWQGLDLRKWINAWQYYTYLWMLGRLKTADQQKAWLKIMHRDFNANPAPAEYFNSIDDFKTYELIRNGREIL